jgi:two-component system cell cycle response regulator
MRSRAVEPRHALQERIKHTSTLPALLDLLGEEIEKLDQVDGYLINLRDSENAYLVSLKVHLTSEFHVLEETYYRYKVALSGDALNLNARAFHSRGIVQCDLDSASEIERDLLRAWKLQQITAIAILDDDNFNQTPIGTLVLLKQEGHIDEQVFINIEQLITLFYLPLRQALEASFLQERRERLESAAVEQSRFLQFVVELNNLTSTETIYQMFATEMFRQFAFDGLGFFLLEHKLLTCKRVEVADPHYEDIGKAWQDYLCDNPYELNTTDGGISHTFLKNLPLMFHDVQAIIKLPMSEKDRHSLEVLKTARTLLLVPICPGRKPIGVLAFYSLLDAVDISESDLHLISKLASLFGAAITNINHHIAIGGRAEN